MSEVSFDNVYFYNWYGNGDIFVGKEFIRSMMKMLPAKKFWYAHAKNPRILEDMDNLFHTKIDDTVMKNDIRWSVVGNDLYINTWIGLEPGDVLPGVGCTVENYFKLFNRMLTRINMKLGTTFFLQGPAYEYLPQVDYSKISGKGIQQVNQFVANNMKDTMIISNGEVQSGQAENFDFSPLIEHIAIEHPDTLFILTSPSPLTLPNVVYTRDIIKTEDGFDLNEISYLGTFCRIFVGRNSSPYVFWLTKDNLFDKDKIGVAFSYSYPGAFFIQSITSMGRYWSNTTKNEERLQILEKVLTR